MIIKLQIDSGLKQENGLSSLMFNIHSEFSSLECVMLELKITLRLQLQHVFKEVRGLDYRRIKFLQSKVSRFQKGLYLEDLIHFKK